MRLFRGWMLIGVCLLLIAGTGCHGLSNGSLSAVAPLSDQPRVGNVYLIRGFIGVFSTGMDDLAAEIQTKGVRAHVYQDTQTSQLSKAIIDAYAGKSDHEPLILIGHSYGADDVVRISRDLNKHNIPVDLLVTFDPVVPGKVPANVHLALNYYKPQGALDALPWLRGIPLEKQKPDQSGSIANINIIEKRPDLLETGTNHFNIEKNRLIYADIMVELMQICPSRPDWLAQSRQKQSSSALTPDKSRLEAIAQSHLQPRHLPQQPAGTPVHTATATNSAIVQPADPSTGDSSASAHTPKNLSTPATRPAAAASPTTPAASARQVVDLGPLGD